ncbi:LOW QUALITY PROTEIN: proline-rich transmembrane protein 4 [Tachyglossus aculeatus]|uniref:LOW QUALITY PROTEIN: proline-rich transmembrane protein 4 n=1 Tax=Tachyglossus aculeatus TaxID=9261 RepID=UPI0018F62A9B|nr:LOW QUALITY PROTEIN: proline-rich transmembrane protein 4 [Tachyglossus aculeatus]
MLARATDGQAAGRRTDGQHLPHPLSLRHGPHPLSGAMAGRSWAGLGLLCWVLLDAPPVAPQPISLIPGAPLTTLAQSPQSEASLLSLNLGLNFKIQVRGPGATRVGAATETQAVQGPAREPEGLRLDRAGGSPPEWGSAEGSSPSTDTFLISEPVPRSLGPAEGLPHLHQHGPGPASLAPGPTAFQPHGSELELELEVALRAGASPTAGGMPEGHRALPLLPSLRVSLAEIADRLGASGFFGTTLFPSQAPSPSPSPEELEPLDENDTGSTLGSLSSTSPAAGGIPTAGGTPATERASVTRGVPLLTGRTPATGGILAPGRTAAPASAPSTDGSSTRSGGPSGQPDCWPKPCDPLVLPEPEERPPAAPLAPLFLSLESDWTAARTHWGLAWEAHVYGAGALFGLVALLALLSLALLPWRCPPGTPCLALLDLLLLSAGTAHAFPLFYDAYGHQARLPALARLLLRDLTLPCLSVCLGLSCLLLARPRSPRCPCGLAALLLLLLALSAGAVLAGATHRPLLPLLLASRGLTALVAALLSGALMVLSCPRGRRAGVPHGGPCSQAATPTPLARGPFPRPGPWRQAARTAPVAGVFGLLSGGLQGYAVLHTLGYGGQPGLGAAWPWWAFQLGARLGEAGVALPLALLGLYPALCSPRPPQRCWTKLLRLSPGAWAKGPGEKPPPGEAGGRAEAELVPLCALTGPGPDLLPPGGGRGLEGVAPAPSSSPGSDGTEDFRPPSPIDLRRSIAEALLGSEALLGPGLLLTGPTVCGAGLGFPEPPSPGPWPPGSSTSSNSPFGLSQDGSSILLCTSPDRPTGSLSAAVLGRSGCGYRALAPACRASPGPLPQERLPDARRQMDELSVGSDTIDL